jgi:hypothetical protein
VNETYAAARLLNGFLGWFMRRRSRLVIGAAVLLLWWSMPGWLRAQGAAAMPNMGPPLMPTGRLAGTPARQNDADPPLGINDTFVSWIDSAVPRNVIGLRFDGEYNNRNPMRATYQFAKGGLPNTTGFPLPETRVNTLEFTSYAEYSISPWFSMFIEAPYRWINPEINANTSGGGDMRYGMRICTWSDENFIATILFRIYQPTARAETLGTGHWSIEPGLAAAYRINPKWHLEGEFRYWIPLTDSDFAGNLFRYGLGLSYGQRQANGVWYMPVAEVVGWTLLSGQTMLASSADSFIIQDARNQTIVNGYLGLRVGYARNADMYIGYGRSFTGDFWSRDMFRFEIRVSY